MTLEDDRKETGKTSAENEELYRLLAENSTDMISKHTPEGVYTYASPACRDLLGYEPEGLLGRSVCKFFHPEDLKRISNPHSTLLERLDPYTVSYRIRRKDGSYTWFETTSHTVSDPETSEVLEIIAVSRDATERKRIEEALRKSEQFHRFAVEAGRIGTWDLDLQTDDCLISPKMAELMDFSPDQAIVPGARWREAIVAEDRNSMASALAASIEGDSPFDLEFRIVLTDGTQRWLYSRGGVTRDASGEALRVHGVSIDVTERKQAEEIRARLAAIVESSDDVIIGKTLEGIITSWNKGAERTYGYSSEEAVGRPISILVPPERPNEIPRILESIRRGEGVDHFETVRTTKDGRKLDISLTVSPIRNSAGVIVGASTIARDITERKRAEEAGRQAREDERQRIARDLHDGVLQDLSYMTATMGLIMLEAEGTDLGDKLQGAIDAVRRAAEGLRVVVNDLRVADELDQPFPRLVESLVERNREMARGQQIGLEVKEGFPSEPLGKAGAQLLRILQEALTNARRHSGAGNVEVRLGKDGDQLVSEVVDEGRGFGLGITPGVGLRSMRERAAALGGKLVVESQVGQGTRVWLRVPIPQKG